MTRAVQRAIDLLAVLRTAPRPLSLQELAEATELDKATALRLLRDLALRQLVSQDLESREYSLGLGLLELAGALPERELVNRALPHLETLHGRVHGRTALSFRVGLRHVVAVEFQQSYPVSLLHGGVGVSAPLHAGAAGRAILAFSPPEVVEEVFRGPLVPVTRNTIVDPVALRVALEQTTALGYALSRGEAADAIAVAAPIFARDGFADACVRISIDGPIGASAERRILKFVTAVRQCARAVSGLRGSAAGSARAEAVTAD